MIIVILPYYALMILLAAGLWGKSKKRIKTDWRNDPVTSRQREYARDLGWRNDPVTSRQREFAGDLGISIPKSATKGQASKLIDKALAAGSVGKRRRRAWHPAHNRIVAAIFSLIIPGAGQLYKRHLLRGILFFVATIIGYSQKFNYGLIAHLCCIAEALVTKSAK